ncbi:MAG: peroxiredoxin [Planctomycetaceae bacterium]|jgi:peroxiredoxin Q/BCP
MGTLAEGSQAPEFTARTSDGMDIRLSDLRGRQGLVLFFYPKDETPICRAEVCAFRDSYAAFQSAGFEVIGVSSDTNDSHDQFRERHQLPFRLISDASGALRRLYQVPRTLGLFPGRTTFVIDAAGIIRKVFTAAFASSEHVAQALQAVQASNAAPQPRHS